MKEKECMLSEKPCYSVKDNGSLNEKKIAVIGIGGVGGYLAGLLCREFPHVTLCARGERRDKLLKEGLILHSDYQGEIIAVPEKVVSAAELEEQDYIFICVKNYSLETVCRELKGAITDKTIIIPVMNGVNPGERVREMTGKGTVIDALIYIVSFIGADGSIIQQGDFSRLRIGIKDADEAQWAKVEEAETILCKAGVDVKAVRDIEVEIWRKYILNCAYNVSTAYYDYTIGQLRNNEEKAKEYEELVREAARVAQKKGVPITKEHVDKIIHRFYFEQEEDATSSLQRDIRAGRKSEVETFSGYIVREADRLGIAVPVSKKMYEGLKEK